MKIVSLFSGAGGFDLGFIKAEHKIIWANDIYHDAAETYRTNIGDHISEKNIFDVSLNEVPKCDIIIGGFPCQGFSVANTKRNIHDTRNLLYLEFLRILEGKKPKYFIAENVKGILNLSKGDVFKIIIKDFISVGYKVKFTILNAANFGVPQKRERVFILGTRDNIKNEPNFPEITHSENGNIVETKKWVSIGEALKNIPDPDKPNNLENHTYSKFKLKFNGYLGNRTIDYNKPAPTVTARGDEKGGVVVLHHPNNKRRMTARELATTQSFPLDYIFYGNRSSVYRQIGNAVPPLLAFNIAKSFKEIE